ncbi:MAG: hypothetical protein WD691_08925 [Acidimicrobiales bacterium]
MELSHGSTTAALTLLRAARLVDIDAGRYIEPGVLLVDGGRILEVSPTSGCSCRRAGCC